MFGRRRGGLWCTRGDGENSNGGVRRRRSFLGGWLGADGSTMAWRRLRRWLGFQAWMSKISTGVGAFYRGFDPLSLETRSPTIPIWISYQITKNQIKMKRGWSPLIACSWLCGEDDDSSGGCRWAGSEPIWLWLGQPGPHAGPHARRGKGQVGLGWFGVLAQNSFGIKKFSFNFQTFLLIANSFEFKSSLNFERLSTRKIKYKNISSHYKIL
jgi:hypothetical protein